MTTVRGWWDAAVGLVLVCLAVVAATGDGDPLRRGVCVALIVGIGLLYAGVLRHQVPSEFGEVPPAHFSVPRASLMQGALLTLTAAAVVLDTRMLFTQGVVIGFLWMSSCSSPQAVVANLISCAVLALAFAAGTGWDPGAALTGVVTESIAFAFSVALGLWIDRIAEWGRERARLLAELTEAQDALAAAHREVGATTERERLARDLHDTTAQSLTSITMLAQRARRESDARETVALIEEIARDALNETRALVAVNAAPDHTDSLAAGLVRLGERFTRETGVTVGVDAAPAAHCGREVEVVLLRCVQEALANIRKHAGARNARVTLRSDGAGIDLLVVDDGRGPGDGDRMDGPGFGLSGMRERLALVGGTLTVAAAAPRGTSLAVHVEPEVEP